MRAFLFAVVLGLAAPSALPAQGPPRPSFSRTGLGAAAAGRWVGTLEYRDFAEPATSTRRTQLPTWLTVRPGREGLTLEYIYDDGPGNAIVDHVTLVIDPDARTYKVLAPEGPPELFTIQGLDALHNGYGTLTLLGNITENHQPAEVRITWTLRPNLLSWLEEVRPSNTPDPFAFRHRYTFTRVNAPPLARPASSPESRNAGNP